MTRTLFDTPVAEQRSAWALGVRIPETVHVDACKAGAPEPCELERVDEETDEITVEPTEAKSWDDAVWHARDGRYQWITVACSGGWVNEINTRGPRTVAQHTPPAEKIRRLFQFTIVHDRRAVTVVFPKIAKLRNGWEGRLLERANASHFFANQSKARQCVDDLSARYAAAGHPVRIWDPKARTAREVVAR